MASESDTIGVGRRFGDLILLARSPGGKVWHICIGRRDDRVLKVPEYRAAFCGYLSGRGEWMIGQRVTRTRICQRCLMVLSKEGFPFEFYGTIVDEAPPEARQLGLF